MSYSQMKRRRVPAVLAVPALVAGALVGAVAPLSVAAPAFADLGECPAPGSYPGIGNLGGQEGFTDDNIAVFVGGDLTTTNGAAELEGVIVVGGDATFDRNDGSSSFNVGTVGVGSQIAPSAGSTMLAVGGDLIIGSQTTLHVGAGAVDEDGVLLGGAIDVGGIVTLTPGGVLETYGGVLTDGLGSDALAPYSGFGAEISDLSAALAAQTAQPAAVAFGQAIFDGAALSDDVYAFSITADELNSVTEVYFTNVPNDVPVVINVTGAGPVTFAPTYFANDGVRADDMTPDSPFGLVSARTMWNFTGAADVTIGGSSQVLGSIMVPSDAGTLAITASTNGRVYTNGDFLTAGVGNETHNYPWFGAAAFDCGEVPDEPVSEGGFTLQKLVINEDELDYENDFAGAIECVVGDDTLSFPWQAGAGEAPLAFTAPVGAECVVSETAPADPEGGEWAPAQITPASFTVGDGTTVAIQVVNTLTPVVVDDEEEEEEDAFGSFQLTKTVVNTDDVDFTGAFSGSVVCVVDGNELTFSWTLIADATTSVYEAPTGAQCEVSESTPTNPEGGTWATPLITPQSFTVGDGTTVAIQVVNTLTPVVVDDEEEEEEEEDAFGSFQLTKVVQNPDSVTFADGFRGTVVCTTGDALFTFAWELSAGETTAVFEVPAGAECEVSETAPTNPEGAAWSTPVISPAEFTVEADELVEVTVTNRLRAVLGETGSDTPWMLLWSGLGAVILGGVLLVARRSATAS